MTILFRLIAVLCGVFILAACATVGEPEEQPINPLLDDIATLVITFDLPRGLGPTMDSLFAIDIVTGGPLQQLALRPVPADVDALPVGLPPPGDNRAYYFFVFTPEDMQRIRDAQISAQLNNATEESMTLRFFPRLCTAGVIDGRMTVSVLAVLPGRNGRYFIKNVKLAELLKQTGGSMEIPACV